LERPKEAAGIGKRERARKEKTQPAFAIGGDAQGSMVERGRMG